MCRERSTSALPVPAICLAKNRLGLSPPAFAADRRQTLHVPVWPTPVGRKTLPVPLPVPLPVGTAALAVPVLLLTLLLTLAAQTAQAQLHAQVTTSPPTWALLQRQLIHANTEACEEFFQQYFDQRGFLLCVERWGGDDGPDDAIENCNDWPLLHALGAPNNVLHMYRKAWEGHLRQYTLAKTKDVPFARDGMYYKEFPCMFDWLHNNEGLLVFHLMGLSEPNHPSYEKRIRRYAGFYMNEDPGATNFDPQHNIIRSMINGSRGPMLRKATALDWAGDPIEVENRFDLGHGERNYQEMLAHFEEYNDVAGDHPLNLLATSLAANAFLITGEEKYKTWILEYVDAWRARMQANNDIIPSNIGLDGKIGGQCNGKWYGGVYGWGFTVVVPQTGALAHRNSTHWGFTGFMNAYLLTGDDRFLEPWRRQRAAINAQNKTVDGRMMYPRMHGDEGWYAYSPQPYSFNNLEIYYLSMRDDDRKLVPRNSWLDYLEGRDPSYPERALRQDLAAIRQRIEAMRKDKTTPDTRLADDPMKYNPAQVRALRQLMLGGIHSGKQSSLLHCRLRYFDPIARRAGLPPDVAALVETMTADQVTFQLVNISQLSPRTVTVQAGAYGEHQFSHVELDETGHMIDSPHFTVELAPSAGAKFTAKMRRYANQPTLRLPWDPSRR